MKLFSRNISDRLIQQDRKDQSHGLNICFQTAALQFSVILKWNSPVHLVTSPLSPMLTPKQLPCRHKEKIRQSEFPELSGSDPKSGSRPWVFIYPSDQRQPAPIWIKEMIHNSDGGGGLQRTLSLHRRSFTKSQNALLPFTCQRESDQSVKWV